MTSAPRVLALKERREAAPRLLPPSGVAGLAPLLLAAGGVLAAVGLLDLGLLYVPSHFGSAEWEIGTLSQTLDALPLTTVGLALLALGVRARGGSRLWTRAFATLLASVAVLCLVALVLLALDIPPALAAVRRAAAHGSTAQLALVSSGLKRGIGKAALFAICYALAYGWMAVTMWRVPRSTAGEAA